MNKTAIEWALNPDGTPGHSWNPITGCLNGCSYCYARKLALTRLRKRYLDNDNLARSGYPIPRSLDELPCDEDNPFYPRFWPERLDQLRSADADKVKPRGIFTCDMSDLFGIGIPHEWTRTILRVMRKNHKHRFYLLTKQPQNLRHFSPFPENCWVGVTICNQDMANTSIPILMNIEAGKRYISIEPMLEPVDLSKIVFGRYLPGNEPYYVNATEDRYIFGDEGGDIELRKIDWIIVGACTGTKKNLLELQRQYPDLGLHYHFRHWTLQPKQEWIHKIVEAADSARIPVFLKNNLRDDYPQNRQEMP